MEVKYAPERLGGCIVDGGDDVPVTMVCLDEFSNEIEFPEFESLLDVIRVDCRCTCRIWHALVELTGDTRIQNLPAFLPQIRSHLIPFPNCIQHSLLPVMTQILVDRLDCHLEIVQSDNDQGIKFRVVQNTIPYLIFGGFLFQIAFCVFGECDSIEIISQGVLVDDLMNAAVLCQFGLRQGVSVIFFSSKKVLNRVEPFCIRWIPFLSQTRHA